MNRHPRIQFSLLVCLWLLAHASVHAHEMGTSALILNEQSTGTGLFVFKRTVGADGKVPPIDFQFQPDCELRNVGTEWEEENEVIQRGSFHCAQALDQHELAASGFTRLSPDLIVVATPISSGKTHAVLTPNIPIARLDSAGKPAVNSVPVSEYLQLGVEHILFGLDHVLFITGLYLLWKKRGQNMKQLVSQFTLFTVGHSSTLALLVLGWIAVPTRAIEAWIALSVLWLAWELIREHPEKTQQPPTQWSHLVLIAAFGLLHGSGFALSMEERGFPTDALFSSLLLFNLGIELGQLAIVGVLMCLFTTLDKTHLEYLKPWLSQLLVLTMGGAALYWTLDRIQIYV